MLYLLDQDGTTVTSHMETPGKKYHNWEVLPKRKKMIKKLLGEGHTIGIVTNQGGIAFGFHSEDDAHAKIKAAIAAVGLPENTNYEVAFHHPNAKLAKWRLPEHECKRKPSGQMILDSMEKLGFDAENTHYIGDRPEDKEAAHRAGVKFTYADLFFGA